MGLNANRSVRGAVERRKEEEELGSDFLLLEEEAGIALRGRPATRERPLIEELLCEADIARGCLDEEGAGVVKEEEVAAGAGAGGGVAVLVVAVVAVEEAAVGEDSDDDLRGVLCTETPFGIDSFSSSILGFNFGVFGAVVKVLILIFGVDEEVDEDEGEGEDLAADGIAGPPRALSVPPLRRALLCAL